MVDRQFARQLEGYSLTTAEILYHMPDFPDLLQSYIWQEYDLAPKFPKLIGFLDFWQTNLDGKLHHVRVANKKLLGAGEVKILEGDFSLN